MAFCISDIMGLLIEFIGCLGCFFKGFILLKSCVLELINEVRQSVSVLIFKLIIIYIIILTLI